MTQNLGSKTIKDPGSVIVWGVFSGNLGRDGLYFNDKKHLYQHFKRAPLHILENSSM